jgi:hypothetical protein
MVASRMWWLYGNRTRVAAVKEKRPIVIQSKVKQSAQHNLEIT